MVSSGGIFTLASSWFAKIWIRIRRPNQIYFETDVAVMPYIICRTNMLPLVLVQARTRERQLADVIHCFLPHFKVSLGGTFTSLISPSTVKGVRLVKKGSNKLFNLLNDLQSKPVNVIIAESH